jgi:hypothetical protein
MGSHHSDGSKGTRISRVVLPYRAESFDRATESFSKALGITFEELDTRHIGLRVAISLEAGVEIIAPQGDEGFATLIREGIERDGEGVAQLVFQVPELEKAAADAKAGGWDGGGFRIDCFDANPGWRSLYSRMQEAPLPPVEGVGVTLIELVPHG